MSTLQAHCLRKLWPKLLRANVIEAITELQQGKKFAPATAKNAKTFLSQSEDGQMTEKELAKRVKFVTRKSDTHIFFEMRDRKQKDVWVHRNYIKK